MAKKKSNPDDVIIIRLWPMTPIFYPMAILALICGIVSHFAGVPAELMQVEGANTATVVGEATSAYLAPDVVSDDAVDDGVSPVPDAGTAPAEGKSQSGLINTILAMAFLFSFAFSMFVVCIDFEVRWSLVAFLLVLMAVVGVLVADRMAIIQLPSAMSVLSNFTLYATPLFYFAVFAVWLILMAISAVIARLHYVKIEHNEIVEHGGVMETQKRMSTFRMHWTKKITDVFEYWLPFVNSGTLIFEFPNDKPLILRNVLKIDKVIKKLDAKSSSFQVKGVE